MKRKVIITADGSKTIQIEDWNEQYHSIHGAIQEANHVFIKHGLWHICNVNLEVAKPDPKKKLLDEISILEIGFGTGLNAFITTLEAKELRKSINYVGVEAFPVAVDEIAQLNYAELISLDASEVFTKLHDVPWEVQTEITPNFTLTKRQQFFSDIDDVSHYHLIYFDAFGARVQPELWTEAIFKKMFDALKPNGVLVTYSAKGSVRRAMQAVGFTVERLEGPPGKREMLRARKVRQH